MALQRPDRTAEPRSGLAHGAQTVSGRRGLASGALSDEGRNLTSDSLRGELAQALGLGDCLALPLFCFGRNEIELPLDADADFVEGIRPRRRLWRTKS
jgi:hypothetical protein